MKYGDYDNVTKDAKTIREILARQGHALILECIADQVGESANTFELSQHGVDDVIDSLTSELREAINERT